MKIKKYLKIGLKSSILFLGVTVSIYFFKDYLIHLLQTMNFIQFILIGGALLLITAFVKGFLLNKYKKWVYKR